MADPASGRPMECVNPHEPKDNDEGKDTSRSRSRSRRRRDTTTGRRVPGRRVPGRRKRRGGRGNPNKEGGHNDNEERGRET